MLALGQDATNINMTNLPSDFRYLAIGETSEVNVKWVEIQPIGEQNQCGDSMDMDGKSQVIFGKGDTTPA